VISIVSDALTHSGLRLGADFRLVAVGLDPKDAAHQVGRHQYAQRSKGDRADSDPSHEVGGKGRASMLQIFPAAWAPSSSQVEYQWRWFRKRPP
jgi:hypothetical protein